MLIKEVLMIFVYIQRLIPLDNRFVFLFFDFFFVFSVYILMFTEAMYGLFF